MLNIAIIGCGYWGPNFIRLVNNHANLNLVLACDKNEITLSKIKEYYSVNTCQDFREVGDNKNIDAVIITTPVTTHFEICKYMLEKKKHVLCEKPITDNLNHAQQLYNLSVQNGALLMTGNTFLYNPSIRFIKEHIKTPLFGNFLYFNFVRTGLGIVRQDVNAMWDLAPHDISILLYFLEKTPISVSAFGGNFIQDGIDDVVFVIIEFESGLLAKIHLSWIDPIKTRKATIVGEKQMITFDDVNVDEKVKIYDKGINYQSDKGDFGDFQLAIRDGEIHIPNIKNKEPLKEELNDFISCITSKKEPISSSRISCDVIKILEAAQNSLDNNNKKVFL